MQLVNLLYCKLTTIGKQLPILQHEVISLNHRPHRLEVSVLPLHHCGSTFHKEAFGTFSVISKIILSKT